MHIGNALDPIEFGLKLWPQVRFYDKEVEVIDSVIHNERTFVPAANKTGKDFTAAFIILTFFLTRSPVRIITTSAKDDHLRVLWGEIGWFIDNCAYRLDRNEGGFLQINHQELRKVIDGRLCPISYCRGMVANEKSIAALGGHHADPKVPDGLPHSLFVVDEASSVSSNYYETAAPWARRMLIIGNTWPCDNFWKKEVKRGDVAADHNSHYYHKVIRIRAKDSPNVRYAVKQEELGQSITNEVIVPGVKTWEEYQRDRKILDKIQQCITLDAEFYEGAEVMLYPKNWLDRAKEIAKALRGRKRVARAIGIDPAEGGDKTAMSAVDEFGLIEQVWKHTPDTSVITGEAIAFMRKHSVAPEYVVFDRGGGGKEHADRLRLQGFPVRTVAFGESLVPDPKRYKRQYPERMDIKESKYAYINRRAEMYGELRLLLDPANELPHGFGLPDEYEMLFEELAPMPLRYDDEGRMEMLPKNKSPEDSDDKMTLTKLIGHSPDLADSLVLAIHGMLHKPSRASAGAVG